MYQKHSFFISGYLNSSAQLFVHLTWSNRLEIGEKQKAHFPNYEKNSWTEASASSATDRNFPPEFYITSITNIHY